MPFQKLCNAAREDGVDETLIKRLLCVKVGVDRYLTIEAMNGCSQEDVLPSLLRSMLIDSLLSELKSVKKPPTLCERRDCAIVRDLGTLCRNNVLCYDLIESWCFKDSLLVNPNKNYYLQKGGNRMPFRDEGYNSLALQKSEMSGSYSKQAAFLEQTCSGRDETSSHSLWAVQADPYLELGTYASGINVNICCFHWTDACLWILVRWVKVKKRVFTVDLFIQSIAMQVAYSIPIASKQNRVLEQEYTFLSELSLWGNM